MDSLSRRTASKSLACTAAVTASPAMALDEPCEDSTLLTLEEQICAAYDAAIEYDPEIVRLQEVWSSTMG
jgi:hypothetical protein